MAFGYPSTNKYMRYGKGNFRECYTFIKRYVSLLVMTAVTVISSAVSSLYAHYQYKEVVPEPCWDFQIPEVLMIVGPSQRPYMAGIRRISSLNPINITRQTLQALLYRSCV
jgi:hypothetical protein